ncbi:alpha/beta hydrolase [Aliidiomarina soli]|uniref:AB hydrolase-1 domain-containing protein n=1 Tax=Aliidiomarina soli TaxID=1928574 RepID=A0A432WIN9_9GAMM|nr:alpha/beta fold hydrolase [Aliidiomarina soli]RUO33670.1 hypothetical protein CWE14_04180 [Aliidiomarina soli]
MHLVRYSLTILIGLLILTGCANLIGRSALHPPMLDFELLPAVEYERIGYQRATYCPAGLPCLAYSVARAYDNQGRETWADAADSWAQQAPLETEAMEVRLRFWPYAEKTAADRSRRTSMRYEIELDTTRGNDKVELLLDGAVPKATRGTYILIHGFRTNKESLFFIAESMRFAGFDVVLVDLYGHGNSEGAFTFSGKPEAQAVSQLLDANNFTGPLHLAGMSMGGTAVSHLAPLRDDIESLLLLAPMLEFVDSFVDAGRAYTRSAHLVPESSLKKGARYALDEAGTTQADTAAVQRVGELGIPILIMGSVEDRITSLDRLQDLAASNQDITLHAVQPRTHHGMILWDTDDFGAWIRWMESKVIEG